MSDATTVKPGKMSSESDAVTCVPDATDIEREYHSIASYLAFLGYDGNKLPAPSSIDQWYAISNLCETL